MTKIILTLVLLIISNTFMTLAWYGNLKLQDMKIISQNTSIVLIVLISWCVALLEYSFLIPANRIGSEINGGPFSLVQLKVIQEVISCLVFGIIVSVLFKGETLQWNHLVAVVFLVLAVYFVFRHTPDAVYENNFQVRLAFALLSTEFVIHLCSCRDEVSIASFADTARMYSSEIEYSEENIDELLFELENELI